MKIAYAAAIGVMAAFAATSALADDTLLNTPNAGAWNVYGQGQTVKNVHDNNVKGGGCKEVTVANATANTWDIGANVNIDQPIKKGDVLTFAAYIKLDSKDAAATASIPADIQINKAPYTAVIQGSFEVTNQWQLLYVAGTADQDYDKGAVVAALNIGGPPKVLCLGPAFVMDGGPAK